MRVDAGGKIGLGHYYRSLNLANTLLSKGHKVAFIHKSSLFWDSIQTSIIHDEIIGCEEDFQYQYIINNSFDIFYVDGILDFSEEFKEKLSLSNVEVVFYQNISSSRHLCNKYILPSIHQQKEFFATFSSGTKIYQGLQYFIFNEKINQIHPKSKINNEVKNVAIISGGSDPVNVLKKLYNHLKDYPRNVHFYYYFGENYQHKSSIPENCRNHMFLPFKFENILKSDLLVSTFGVSTYEFMALKMPVIAVGHQQSNAEAANYLANYTQGIVSLGIIDEINKTELFACLNQLTSIALRSKLVINAGKFIDLKGINRIIKIIENE